MQNYSQNLVHKLNESQILMKPLVIRLNEDFCPLDVFFNEINQQRYVILGHLIISTYNYWT